MMKSIENNRSVTLSRYISPYNTIKLVFPSFQLNYLMPKLGHVLGHFYDVWKKNIPGLFVFTSGSFCLLSLTSV